MQCSEVLSFSAVVWFDPAVVCSAVYLSAVKYSAAAALCGVVLICLTIYSHNLFINLHHCQRESNNQGFTVCVMCGSH